MPRSRMYSFERAFRRFRDAARVFQQVYLKTCGRTWDFFRSGLGAKIIRWLLIAAAIAVALYSGFEVASGEYAVSHNLAAAVFEFLLASAGAVMFALVYSLFVYFATTYIAAFMGGLAVLTLGAALGLVGAAVLLVVVVALLVWTALSFLLFVPLRLGHWLWLQQRKITYKCPYDDCRYRGLPVHVCGCGAEYADLEPNFYGILHHTCCHRDGDVQLPTLFHRNKLARLCGRCRRPLLHSSLGELREWPIFVMGGPNAGKTIFLAQSVRRVLTVLGKYPGSVVRIDSGTQQREHAEHLRLLDQGQVLAKTSGDVAAALGLAVRIPRGLRALVYLFDKPGEYFQSMRQFGKMQGIEGLKGILLLVDPFSLPGLEDHAHGAHGQLKPSEVPFHTIASNLIHAVELMLHGGQHPSSDVALAVVLTKTDALPVDRYPFLAGLMRPDHQTPDALCSSCREAMSRLGAGASVRLLEQKFKNVRYFACTATGRMPDLRDASPFRPAGVTQPVLWLLNGASAGKDNRCQPAISA